jgi:hypothetical protein
MKLTMKFKIQFWNQKLEKKRKLTSAKPPLSAHIASAQRMDGDVDHLCQLRAHPATVTEGPH